MRTLVFVVLIALLALPAFTYDWVTSPINGHRYTLVDSDTYTEAENQALALGGHLVTILSQEENNWVYNWALNNTGPDTYRAWIGLYQLPGSVEPVEGWVWSSGEPVVYTNWQTTTSEPNDYYGNSNPENWAQMYIRQHDWDEIPSYWNDTWTNRPNTQDIGIVEVVPEPTSLLALCGGVAMLGFLKRRR